jgi:hypothetical protein
MYFGQGSASQKTIDAYETTKDKYSHAAGHDARGWAWGLYNFSPAGGSLYSFNDYKWSSQATANWEMVWGIRATSRPVGAIVEAGIHAVDLIGYKTLNDPFTPQQQTLYGFYILDPWYGRGNSGMPHWPSNGFAPNAYVSIGNWNTYYFLQFNGLAYWQDKYVPILQKYGATQPENSPTVSYGEYVYNNTLGPAAADVTATESYAIGGTSPDIETAVAAGLSWHDLLDADTGLGIDLHEYTIGNIAHVASLDRLVAPYDLVELAVGGAVRAVAMVIESPGGYAFGELRGYAGGDFELASMAGRNALAIANGMEPGAMLEWAPSVESPSPFDPFLVGSATSSGSHVYVSSAGRFTAIHLAVASTTK